MSKMTFNRIRAKVTRAEQHIQDFQLGCIAFRDSKPYSIAAKEDSDAGQRSYYVSKVDPIPDTLTAIAADVIQNLRSSLDHVAYQLVLNARGGAKPDWKVYYPIAGSAAYYKATRNGVIKGVPQPTIDAIDATEPYKGGRGHALWQLKELSNPDKHELLIGAGSMFMGVDVSVDFRHIGREAFGPDFNINIPQIFLRPANKLYPMKVGDKLYGEPIDHKVTEERTFTFDIAFHAPGVVEGEPAVKTPQDLTNLVGGIINSFKPFFG